MGGMPQGQREKGMSSAVSRGKFGQPQTPPPVQTKTPEPNTEQVGMTAQKKTEETKKQQKASLTGTSLDDGGKTVLGG